MSTERPIVELRSVSQAVHPNRRVSNQIATKRLVNPFRLFSKRYTLSEGEFFALRDVSVSVRKGETLGVIGSCASSRTLLAMLLNGMAHPDEGVRKLRGRALYFAGVGKVFKPMLTVLEAARFGATVYGAPRKGLKQHCEKVISIAGLTGQENSMLYDIDSVLVKHLGYAIQVLSTGDLNVFNNLFRVGNGDFRIEMFEKVQAKIKRETSVLVAGPENESLVAGLCDRLLFLEDGTLFESRPEPEGLNPDALPSFSLGENLDLNEEDEDGDGTDALDDDQTLSGMQVVFTEVNGLAIPFSAVSHLAKSGDRLEVRLQVQSRDPISVELVEIAICSQRGYALASKAMKVEKVVGSESVPITASVNIPDLNPGAYQLRFRYREKGAGSMLPLALCLLGVRGERALSCGLKLEAEAFLPSVEQPSVELSP